MIVYGLIGYPLRYSLSPTIHQAAYRASGMEAAYLLWPIAPEHLAEQVSALRQRPDVGGFNVTVPHKTSIVSLLDAITPSVLDVNAVNTVVRDGSQLVGHNTDLSGFRASLLEGGVTVAGQHALVLGAGGAARSVCHVLLGLGVEKLYLVNRTRERAELLRAELVAAEKARASQRLAPTGGSAGVGRRPTRHLTVGECVQVVDLSELSGLAADLTLVVNCTSSQDPWSAFGLFADDFWSHGQGWAVDLAYGRMLAGFLTVAKQRDWHTLSGEGMLLWQAAHAFELWAGHAAPEDVMRQAMLRALGQER